MCTPAPMGTSSMIAIQISQSIVVLIAYANEDQRHHEL